MVDFLPMITYTGPVEDSRELIQFFRREVDQLKALRKIIINTKKTVILDVNKDGMEFPGLTYGSATLEELMRELVRLFFEDAPKLLADARKALQEEDAGALHHAAHSLKGMVGNYAAVPAFQAVSQLTHSTRAGNLDQAAELLDVADREVARLSVALRQFVKEL